MDNLLRAPMDMILSKFLADGFIQMGERDVFVDNLGFVHAKTKKYNYRESIFNQCDVECKSCLTIKCSKANADIGLANLMVANDLMWSEVIVSPEDGDITKFRIWVDCEHTANLIVDEAFSFAQTGDVSYKSAMMLAFDAGNLVPPRRVRRRRNSKRAPARRNNMRKKRK